MYLRFEASPDEEFDYMLARDLGMTVARLRAELSNDEYVSWSVYYGRRAQRQELAIKEAEARHGGR